MSGRFTPARSQSFASHMQAPRVEHATSNSSSAVCSRCRAASRSSFSQPAARGFGGGAGESAAHGWSRFGEPIHGASGSATGQASQFNRSYSPSASSREGYGGGAVRMSPPIVQQRGYSGGASSQGSYSQPRSFGGSRAAPSAAPSRGAAAPSHASSGGGHSGGGGGHHR